MRRQSILGGLVLLLLVAGCGGGDPDQGPAFPPADADHAPDPEVAGPYAVGVRTLWLEDPDRDDPLGGEGHRRFRIEVWYPATEDARGRDLDVLDLADEAPPEILERLGDTTITPLEQPAVRDAEPWTDEGPFPVVLFSHGNGGVRAQSFSYTAHLASHGHVVLSPDHVGNTLFDLVDETNLESAAMRSVLDRPADLTLILDHLEDGTLSEGGWLSSICDLGAVGVTGHSFGGFTSLFIVNPEAEVWDSRIDAAVPVTPATSLLAVVAAPPASVVAPVLYVGATADATLDYQLETVDAYEVHRPPKAMAGVVDAGHFSFTEICGFELEAAAIALGMDDAVTDLLGDGCGAQNIAVPRAHALNNRYGTAWFNLHLRGSTETGTRWLDLESAPEDVELRVDLGG